MSERAAPARAQTEQFTAQRPTNKCFHIYPPPLVWDSWGLEWKARGLGGVGRVTQLYSKTSVGKIVLSDFMAVCSSSLLARNSIRMESSCRWSLVDLLCAFVSVWLLPLFSANHHFSQFKLMSAASSNVLIRSGGDNSHNVRHLEVVLMILIYFATLILLFSSN